MEPEKTVVKVMRLPEGVDWQWHPDLNIVTLSDRLDEAGRMVALLDLQAQWRRSMIRVVPPRARRPKSAPPSYSLLRGQLGAPYQMGGNYVDTTDPISTQGDS